MHMAINAPKQWCSGSRIVNDYILCAESPVVGAPTRVSL